MSWQVFHDLEPAEREADRSRKIPTWEGWDSTVGGIKAAARNIVVASHNIHGRVARGIEKLHAVCVYAQRPRMLSLLSTVHCRGRDGREPRLDHR